MDEWKQHTAHINSNSFIFCRHAHELYAKVPVIGTPAVFIKILGSQESATIVEWSWVARVTRQPLEEAGGSTWALCNADGDNKLLNCR